LYNPVGSQKEGEESVGRKNKNFAKPGSILKVWEGMFDLGTNESFNCQMYSTDDIKKF
jgi:hypothetical protein